MPGSCLARRSCTADAHVNQVLRTRVTDSDSGAYGARRARRRGRARERGSVAADTSTAQRRQSDLEPSAAQRLSAWLKGYKPLSGVPDELFDAGGRPRDHWLAFLGDFAEYPEAEFNAR